jgi:nanoRNase/pAp phosphatase (c-di-AMP/oligoRNAs hydrolase)
MEDATGVAFPFHDPAFGSTSTMVGTLFLENGIPMDTRVATALTYGIRTDTQDLARGATDEDERVYEWVYGLADKQALARIERARVSREYFVVLERGLRRALISDFALTTWLGAIEHSDMVAEVADLLFRLEGMRWVMVSGHTGPMLFASIRSVGSAGAPDAGAVAREISDGRGGGHPTYSACQIQLPEDGPAPDAAYESLRDRFLDLVGAKQSLTQPLTDSPIATAAQPGRRLRRPSPEGA